MRRKWVTFVVAIFCATCVAERADATRHSPPGQSTGTYRVRAGGYYTGNGTVVVVHKKFTVNIPVDSDDGEQTLSASNIQIKNNHFSGNGKLGIKNVALVGRFDIPDCHGDEVQAARVSCTLECEDGHRGRFVGYLDDSVP